MSTFVQSGATSPLTIDELESMLIATCGAISGTDSDDKDYTSIKKLWHNELKASKAKPKETKWYNNAQEFWEDPEKCPITDDGVLQGFGELTPADTIGSNDFLDGLATSNPSLEFGRAADCGAGMGRVTKNFLLPRFQHVDLIEQSPRLSAATNTYIDAPEDQQRITCIVQGLQDFNPPPNTYDVIWVQWVIGHIFDLDVIQFFKRCAAGLKPNGLVVLKDNIASSGYTFVVDKEDSSVSRSLPYMKLLITLAGLKIDVETVQTGFPKILTPVIMLSMSPIDRAS
jgi:protein N-terminal methyltransferase